ncbi:MAG: HDOD domain-containing protein [Thermodesulfobacteriota bacterium]
MNDGSAVLQQRIASLQAYIGKMPALSPTVSKVMATCRNPDTSPADLTRIISMDPVLMGKIISLINSAYYGFSQKITSLPHAIIMLGMNTIKNLVLSTAILGNVNRLHHEQVLDMDAFWQHSLSVGVTAKLLAEKRGVRQSLQETYFVAGLVHDIGKVAINNRFPIIYSQALETAGQKEVALYRAERKVVGIDHASMGALIAAKWRLGDDIADTIRYHHDLSTYQGEHEEIVATVALANYIANTLALGFSGDGFPDKISSESLQRLRIPPADFKEVAGAVNDEVNKARVFLGLT